MHLGTPAPGKDSRANWPPPGSHSPPFPTQPTDRNPPRVLEAAFGERLCRLANCCLHTLLSRPSTKEPRVLTSVAQLRAIFLGCKSLSGVNTQNGARSASVLMSFQRGREPQLFAKSHLGFILQMPRPFFCVTRERLGEQLSAYT